MNLVVVWAENRKLLLDRVGVLLRQLPVGQVDVLKHPQKWGIEPFSLLPGDKVQLVYISGEMLLKKWQFIDNQWVTDMLHPDGWNGHFCPAVLRSIKSKQQQSSGLQIGAKFFLKAGAFVNEITIHQGAQVVIHAIFDSERVLVRYFFAEHASIDVCCTASQLSSEPLWNSAEQS
jgi:hypothetical protein